MNHKLILILLLFFWVYRADAVSRIGGGKIQSNHSGFEMNINSNFHAADIQTDAVRCLGPLGMIQRGSSTFFGTQFFEIAEFSNEFPDAISLNANDIRERFIKSGWTSERQQYCRVTMRLQTTNIVAYLVTWGSGKGFVMKGTLASQTEQAMREALDSLKISGDCVWK